MRVPSIPCAKMSALRTARPHLNIPDSVAHAVGVASLEDASMTERFDPDRGEWSNAQSGRSPSPEPTYDRLGMRTNTREFRLRERLNRERLALVEKMMTLQPTQQVHRRGSQALFE